MFLQTWLWANISNITFIISANKWKPSYLHVQYMKTAVYYSYIVIKHKVQYNIRSVLSEDCNTSAIHVWYPAKKKNNTDYLEKFCKAKLRVAVTGTLNVTHVLPQDCHLHQPGQPNYSEVDWWHDFHANCIPWPVCCPTPIPTRVVSGYVGSRSR